MTAPTRSVPVPASLVLVAERVEHRLREMLDAEIERWGALDDGLVEPLCTLKAFVLDGGKRLRPAFCHWGFVGAGGDADDDPHRRRRRRLRTACRRSRSSTTT